MEAKTFDMDSMITFPTTTEAFISYQESGINRSLDDLEKKLTEAVVGLVNDSYQEGVNGKENSYTMKCVQRFYEERGKSTVSFVRMWESICWWCDKAYQAGQEAAQHD